MNTPLHRLPPVKVLIVDDSAFMRSVLKRMVESEENLCVVGTAENGNEALEKISALNPDVITLDVEMPGMGGLEILPRIMCDFPRPVIMVSSLTQQGAETTLEALSIGAFDYLPKPLFLNSTDTLKLRVELIAKIRAATESRRARLGPEEKKLGISSPLSFISHPINIVALGTSTGGPKALQEILPTLPSDLPVGILIVQHMPAGFTAPFAQRLNKLCQLTVREAEHDDPVNPGVVYVAPAGKHMTVHRRGISRVTICLADDPEFSLHIPSADKLMESVANVFKASSMGIIMTGMGSDGVLGMAAIRRAGGFTVGQDQASCTVYGMPRSCAQADVLDVVVPLGQIPKQILRAIQYKKRA